MRVCWIPGSPFFTGMCIAAVMFAVTPEDCHAVEPQNVMHIRVNQLGYLPDEDKVAVIGAPTRESVESNTFRLVRLPDQTTISVQPHVKYREEYGARAIRHVYELNFTELHTAGMYRIECDGTQSHTFRISDDVYRRVIPTSLQFFRVQRCGNSNPAAHGPCHLNKSVIVGGRQDGQTVDVGGGWHDAGDYIKFLGQTSAATWFLLSAYAHAPDRFRDSDANEIPDVLDESRIALHWMTKMWDEQNQTLLFQCADSETDHWPWRLPEGDDSSNDPVKKQRKVFACSKGRGANYAGRTSATLALASVLFRKMDAKHGATSFADACLAEARSLYAFGRVNRAAQPATFNSGEDSWRDDMALGAIELFLATGEASFLADAKTWMGIEVEKQYTRWSLNSFNMHYAAHYRMGMADPQYRSKAVNILKNDLQWTFAAHAKKNVFRETLDVMQWGSSTEMCGRALVAFYFEELTQDDSYHRLAMQQWDYTFGTNPWGISMVSGLGTIWPRHPHHQIADRKLNPNASELTGFWTEGGIELEQCVFDSKKNGRDDPLSDFQSPWAVFHDDVDDYTTNEPTVFANAIGIALAARIGRAAK